jgi:hypothetical protein
MTDNIPESTASAEEPFGLESSAKYFTVDIDVFELARIKKSERSCFLDEGLRRELRMLWEPSNAHVEFEDS